MNMIKINNGKTMTSKIVITAIALLGLTACNSDNQEVNQADFEKAKFESYAKFKKLNIDDQQRYDRIYSEYQKKQLLAAEITKTQVLEKSMIDAQVDEFRNQLLISSYFDQYLTNNVTDQGIQNFYTSNIDKYKSKKIWVAHILLRTTPAMNETERQALLTTAFEAYSRVNTGEDFAAIAQEISQDKVSAQKGGDLGWISEGAVSKAFSKVAFDLKKGEVAEPFSTTFGFHIVKALSEPQEVKKPLEAVKGDIRYQLRSQAKSAEISRLIKTANSEN